MKVKDSPVRITTHGDRLCAITNDDAGSQFHIWLSLDGKPLDDRVYSNKSGRHTIRLSASGGIGKIVASHIMSSLPSLLPGALLELQGKREKEEKLDRLAVIKNRKQAKAEKLFKLLMDARYTLHEFVLTPAAEKSLKEIDQLIAEINA